MRLLIVPFVLVAMLIQAPTSALGIGNQEAAERIADMIGERFPDADIDVSFQGGRVWLKGEAASQAMRTRIVEQIFQIPGVHVNEINDEIQIVASQSRNTAPARSPAQTARPVTSAVDAPVPMPNNNNATRANSPTPRTTGQTQQQARQQQAQQQQQAQTQQQQQSQVQQALQQARQIPDPPQTTLEALLSPHPHSVYAAAHAMRQPQQSVIPHHIPTSFAQPHQVIPHHVNPHQAWQQQAPQHGPPLPQHAHMMHRSPHHGHGPGQPGAPMAGRYNQPNMPNYAWPSYANHPNYAQVAYPRAYSPKAWPYIGPFYPYPQVPLGWRKVTLEHHNGWWWLDFDDGTPTGPFSGLFRQPVRYTY